MNPLIEQRSPGTTSKPKLGFWAIALGVGAYFGYGIAYSNTLTGLATLGALFAAFMIVAIFTILVAVAALSALRPHRRGRPAARTALVAAVLDVVGGAIGWAVTSALLA